MSTAEPQQPADPVTDDTGRCQLSAAASLEELPALDVEVIAGSLLDEDPDERVVPSRAPAETVDAVRSLLNKPTLPAPPSGP
jgi:hypothetical protein